MIKDLKVPLLLVTAALLCGTPVRAQLTLRIDSMPTPPADAKVFVAGSFNGWNPGASEYQLQPGSSGRYAITLPNTVRGPIEFKFTLGSWQTVETTAQGGGIDNRSLIIPAHAITHSVVVGGWQDAGKVEVRASTARKSVTVLSDSFAIPQFGRTRRVWLYLPPDYATSNKTYPVLYMHDGQNVFDNATSFAGEWGVDETLDSLFAAGDSGSIVVAVDHGAERRLTEYSPWPNARYGGGEGAGYVEFLVNTLKPYIDSHYRTRTDRLNTAVAGSSMGGLISLYALLKHPDVFGRAGVFSPSLWFSDSIFTFARQVERVASDSRVYFVSGALEAASDEDPGRYVRDQIAMVDMLVALGLRKGETIVAVVQPDGKHSEWFWRREFPVVYHWLMARP